MNVLITAGPTREPIDPVRYLSNRSSGKMGYALAQAALEAGHRVTLISGPVSIAAPEGVTLLKIETAQQMHDAVRDHLSAQDIAIFAAAVADYTPIIVADQKLKKQAEELTLTLRRTPDILGSARSEFGFKGLLVGFAAETEQLIAHATEKMQRKGCDLLVANDVSRPGIGFEADDNEVTLLRPGCEPEKLARASKHDIARAILAACHAPDPCSQGVSP